MAVRTDLDYILKRLKKEMMYDNFLCAIKLISEGETFVKKASKAGTGGSACIFLPKRYIGQQLRVMITPLKAEVIEANEAVLSEQSKIIKANHKIRELESKLKELKTGDTEKTDTNQPEPEEIEDIHDLSEDEDEY